MQIPVNLTKLLRRMDLEERGFPAVVDQITETSEKVDTIEMKVIGLEKVAPVPGPKGDKGDPGETIVGPKGEDGKDGKDGKDGETIAGPEGPAGKPGKDGRDGQSIQGKDGKDGSPDSAEEIAAKLNTVEELVNIKMLKGYKKLLDRKSFDKFTNEVYTKGQIDQRWHGGGLSRVAHDATLTGSGTTADPLSAVASGTSPFETVTNVDALVGTFFEPTDFNSQVSLLVPAQSTPDFKGHDIFIVAGDANGTGAGADVYLRTGNGFTSGRVGLNDGKTGFTIYLDMSAATDFRAVSFQDKDGTIALLSDIPAAVTWKSETPSGTINGVNKIFTLASTPTTNSLFLFLNGAFQDDGGGDYTLSGSTITFVLAPTTGSVLRAKYQ